MSALAGKRIVNTRALHQAAALDALLAARGALSLSYPSIQRAPPSDLAPLDGALRDLAAGRFEWLLLTSANTVEALAERLALLDLTIPPVKVAAVGPATAHAAAHLGVCSALLPKEFTAEGLAEAISLQPGTHILLPLSALARPALAARLRQQGADVVAVHAYTSVRGRGGIDLPELLAAGAIDAVTFTSSSTVTYLVERLHAESGVASLPASVYVACIGPRTSATARTHGLRVDVQPAVFTLPALVDALDLWFAAEATCALPHRS